MFEKIKILWDEKGFEILLGLCIAFILIFALFRIGKTGTWDSSYSYSTNIYKKPKKSPPKDSKGELECRRVLRKIFGRSFNKSRPNFLNNPVTGGRFNLELDCYDQELRLACEYNGAQHYKYIPYFHKNREAFLNQKYRDDMKRRICKENGINLIEVPNTVKNIEGFLVNNLKNLGYLK